MSKRMSDHELEKLISDLEEAGWISGDECPCCGMSKDQAIALGAPVLPLSRQVRRALRSKERSRKTGHKRAKTERGRSAR